MDIQLFELDKPKDYKLKVISPLLPQPVFRWILAGPSNSGKTTLLKNILFSKQFGYRDYFDEIYLWLGSEDDKIDIHHLSKINGIMDEKICITSSYNDERLKVLLNEIEQSEKNKVKKSRILFVFDDMITNGISHKCKLNAIDEVFIRGRHIAGGISIILSTQKYMSLNNNQRLLNATQITLFSGTQSTDLDGISKEHNSIRTREEMMEIFRNNLQKRFDFLTVYTKENIIKDKKFLSITN